MKKLFLILPLFILAFFTLTAMPAAAEAPQSPISYYGLSVKLLDSHYGIRSLYDVDLAAVAALEDDGYTVEFGAVMAVGTSEGVVRTAEDIAVTRTEDGFIPTISGAEAICVYSSDESVTYDTQKFVGLGSRSARFAYTTTFVNDPDAASFQTGCIYAGFLALTRDGDTTYVYTPAVGDSFGGEDSKYGTDCSLYELSKLWHFNPNAEEEIRKNENILSVLDTYTEGFTLTLSDDEAYYSVTDYAGSDAEVYIPRSFNDKPVKQIGEGAFADCTDVTRVSISGTVTDIGSHAFDACIGLTIYAEACGRPSGWDASWNPSDCPVVWGNRHETAYIEESAATCTENGVKAHEKCSVCEKTFLDGAEVTDLELLIPAAHSLESVAAVAATCHSAGVAAHDHCTACKKNFVHNVEKTDRELALPATGKHTFSSSKDTSCNTPGCEYIREVDADSWTTPIK